MRKRVAALQNNQNKSFRDLSNSRKKAKQTLLKELNPIIEQYMKDNKIRLVIDKKSVLLGDTNLEITNQVIDILNKKITSLNIK